MITYFVTYVAQSAYLVDAACRRYGTGITVPLRSVFHLRHLRRDVHEFVFPWVENEPTRPDS